MARIVRTAYRYKRPPRRKKAVPLEVPAVVKAAKVQRFHDVTSEPQPASACTPAIGIVRKRRKARRHCVDCGLDTFKADHYYMVGNELWAAAGMEPFGGMLCLHCLEERIGRKLVYEDFTAIVPRVLVGGRVPPRKRRQARRKYLRREQFHLELEPP
jgi:hypothetical protein